MKRILLVSLFFAFSAVQAAGPQFASPPMPAGVRAIPSFPTLPIPAAISAPRVFVPVPVAPQEFKVAPAPGSGSLGAHLPRSFDGVRTTTTTTVSPAYRPAAVVPAMPGSIAMPVFPQPAGAIVFGGAREAAPGVFLDFARRM